MAGVLEKEKVHDIKEAKVQTLHFVVPLADVPTLCGRHQAIESHCQKKFTVRGIGQHQAVVAARLTLAQTVAHNG